MSVIVFILLLVAFSFFLLAAFAADPNKPKFQSIGLMFMTTALMVPAGYKLLSTAMVSVVQLIV